MVAQGPIGFQVVLDQPQVAQAAMEVQERDDDRLPSPARDPAHDGGQNDIVHPVELGLEALREQHVDVTALLEPAPVAPPKTQEGLARRGFFAEPRQENAQIV